MRPKLKSLNEWQFDNRFLTQLPADTCLENTPRQVWGCAYSYVSPTPVRAPKTIAFSAQVADLLDLSPEVCQSEEFAAVFAGNQLATGMTSYATCYGGHQFGQWAGQLGDGRAIHLGDVINSDGVRLALQLKGAGATPYSRHADGLAVLRSSLREFLCSEAMYHLGVPTTRALSLVLTGEQVRRDMFYDGNPRYEQGAVVCRVAPSFTRFGHFQLPAARKDIALLKKLVDYSIETDFSQLATPCSAVYGQWFDAICQRTALLIVQWWRVGFVHGVMNTDNMSILGLTIDYGPYGWLENFDLQWTPNTTDAQQRRYCFGKQAEMAFWNLTQLAHALYPLINDAQPLLDALQHYNQTFTDNWQTMMANKLGLAVFNPATDSQLIAELIELLQSVETDMTLFYRNLARIDMSVEIDRIHHDAWLSELESAYYQLEQVNAAYKMRRVAWFKRYQHCLKQADVTEIDRRQRMNSVNPLYVFRNYLAQLAIDSAEEGDYQKIATLLQVLQTPYTENSAYAHYAQKRPDWAKERAGCSMLSCSS